MNNSKHVYLTIDWQEQNVIDNTNRRQIWEKQRRVLSIDDLIEVLPCSNPDCEGGGFEIGDRIRDLLAQGKDSEQNSLICRNAIHPDRNKRCLHTIIYSIACIRPYQRESLKTSIDKAA